jgi:hypothetical protein
MLKRSYDSRVPNSMSFLFQNPRQSQLGEKQAYGMRDTYEYLDFNPALNWIDSETKKDQIVEHMQALIDVAKKRDLELTFSSGRWGVGPMSSEEALARVLKAKSTKGWPLVQTEDLNMADLPYFLQMRSTNGQPIDYDYHPESEAWDLFKARGQYDSAKNNKKKQ